MGDEHLRELWLTYIDADTTTLLVI